MLIEKPFGELVKEQMKKKKITYEQLSERAEINTTSISDIILRGHIPGRSFIERICTVLGIKPREVKEFRVLSLIEDLENAFEFFTEDNLDTIEEVIETMYPYKNPIGEIDFGKSRKNIKFVDEDVIVLRKLPEKVKKAFRNMYKEAEKIYGGSSELK